MLGTRKKVIGGGAGQSTTQNNTSDNEENSNSERTFETASEGNGSEEEEEQEQEGEEEQEQEGEEELWITVFKKNNEDAKDASQILAWYQLASPKAENPYLVIDVNDNAKMVFKYIIGGMINAQKINTDIDLVKTINDLIEYFKTLKKSEQESEFVIFDLILKANTLINSQAEYPDDIDILTFDKSFMPIPINTVTDEDDAKKALVSCGQVVSKTKVELPFNYAEDFSEHFKPQFIDKLGINDFLGVKKNDDLPLETWRFIKFLKISIKNDTIEALNDLQDISESKPFDLEANYNYTIKVAYYWVNIVLSCLHFITSTLARYESTALTEKLDTLKPYLLEKIKAVKDFVWLMVINGIYKNVNRKGLEVPRNFFHDFLKFYESKFSKVGDDDNSKTIKIQCTVLKWFFSKLSNILQQSVILEIKTSECFYDLFDSIDLGGKNIDISGNIIAADDKKTDILRTIHFRTDFIIAPETISIDGFVIPKTFWLHVDKTVCIGKKPFSVFLGILNDATKLEPFFYTLLWELGPDFEDDDDGTLHEMASAVGALQDNYCTELNPVDLPKSILRAPNDTTSDDLYEVGALTIFNNDIFLAAELLFTAGITSSFIEKLLDKCGAYKLDDFGRFPLLSDLTEKQISGYNVIEKVVFEIAKFYTGIGEITTDVITRRDLKSSNFPLHKVYQIHLLIQHKPAYIQISHVFKFIIYLLECINFSITDGGVKKGGMIVEQEIQLDESIVTTYSHLLLNEEYFNLCKVYNESPTASALEAVNSKYVELAKDLTPKFEMDLALAEMYYNFTADSRDNFIKKFAAAGGDEVIKNNHIKDAALQELKRNSTHENRTFYLEALTNLGELKTPSSYDEIIAIAKTKMEAYMSKESIEEYNLMIHEYISDKKITKESYPDIRTTGFALPSNLLTGLHTANKEMPNLTAVEFRTKSPIDRHIYRELKTEIVAKIMAVEENISFETITNFRKAIDNVIKVNKDDTTKKDWYIYYQTVLLLIADSLQKSFFSGDYINTKEKLSHIMDSLKNFKLDDYPGLSASITSIKETIEKEYTFLKDRLYPNLIINTVMPKENKDFKEAINIYSTVNSFIDDIDEVTLQNFTEAIDAMIEKKTAVGAFGLVEKWKDYHINFLYELLKYNIPRVYTSCLYSYRVEVIARVFILFHEIKRLALKYLKPDFLDEIDLLIENMVMEYEKAILKRPRLEEVLFENPISNIPANNNIFVYLKNYIKTTLSPIPDTWTGWNILDILINKFNDGHNIIADIKLLEPLLKGVLNSQLVDFRQKLERDTSLLNLAHLYEEHVKKYYLLQCMLILNNTKNNVDNFFNFFSDLTTEQKKSFVDDEECKTYLKLIKITAGDCKFDGMIKWRYFYSIFLINLFKTSDPVRISYYKRIGAALKTYNKNLITSDSCAYLLGDYIKKYSKHGVELMFEENRIEVVKIFEDGNNVIKIIDDNFLTAVDDETLIDKFVTVYSRTQTFFTKLQDTKVFDFGKRKLLEYLGSYLYGNLAKRYTATNTIKKTFELLIANTEGSIRGRLIAMKEDYEGGMTRAQLWDKYKDFKIIPAPPVPESPPLVAVLPTFPPSTPGTDLQPIPFGERGDGEIRRLGIAIQLFSNNPLMYVEQVTDNMNELLAIRADKKEELITYSKKIIKYYLGAYEIAYKAAATDKRKQKNLTSQRERVFAKILPIFDLKTDAEIKAKVNDIEYDDESF